MKFHIYTMLAGVIKKNLKFFSFWYKIVFIYFPYFLIKLLNKFLLKRKAGQFLYKLSQEHYIPQKILLIIFINVIVIIVNHTIYIL